MILLALLLQTEAALSFGDAQRLPRLSLASVC